LKKILVAYTTNSGTTADVAAAVGEVLGSTGSLVEVRRLEEVTDLAPYAAVVVGGPMIMGWHRAAARFVRRHQAGLARVPVAYFFTARSLTRLGETDLDGVPVSVDPDLAKPPANPPRLSLRERYSTVKNYLRPVLRSAPRLRPVSVAFFGGRLNMAGMKLWQILFVVLVIQAKPGGTHNLPFIREWAAGLGEKFTAAGAPEGQAR
jgi:menaquinone-dependent protoporphyrinogen IX oxidase